MRQILLVTALVLVNSVFLALPRGDYRAIVIHHSASSAGDYRDIRRAHWARGWFEIAYHLVLSNGSTEVEFGHLEPTRRYLLGIWSVATRSGWHNLSAVHLCVVGNFETAPPSVRMQGALGHAVRALQERYGIAASRIFLHRDCSPTACPGSFVTRSRIVEWAAREAACPQEIQEQHRRAILRGRWAPILHGVAWGGANVFFLALWVLATRRPDPRTLKGRANPPTAPPTTSAPSP